MTYYQDETKLTYDRAEIIVDRYIEDHSRMRSRVTTTDIAREYDIVKSHHNLIRIGAALDDRLEVIRDAGSKARQYKL